MVLRPQQHLTWQADQLQQRLSCWVAGQQQQQSVCWPCKVAGQQQLHMFAEMLLPVCLSHQLLLTEVDWSSGLHSTELVCPLGGFEEVVVLLLLLLWQSCHYTWCEKAATDQLDHLWLGAKHAGMRGRGLRDALVQ